MHASARRSTSSNGAGLGSKGPKVVSPLTSHWTWPGSTIRPAGKVVPRITRATCPASTSSLPIPFCTEQTAPSANACAVAAIAGSVCIAFVATIPKSQAGSSPASRRRAHAARRTSPAPESRSPFALIASTCGCARSYAHTSTSSSLARFAAKIEPTAPQPTMHTLMRASRRGSRSSRPPVRPEGRRISTSAMIAARKTSRVPDGRSSLSPSTCTPFSAWLRNESSPLTASAPTTAPQRLVSPPTTSIASVRKVSSR